MQFLALLSFLTLLQFTFAQDSLDDILLKDKQLRECFDGCKEDLACKAKCAKVPNPSEQQDLDNQRCIQEKCQSKNPDEAKKCQIQCAQENWWNKNPIGYTTTSSSKTMTSTSQSTKTTSITATAKTNTAAPTASSTGNDDGSDSSSSGNKKTRQKLPADLSYSERLLPNSLIFAPFILCMLAIYLTL